MLDTEQEENLEKEKEKLKRNEEERLEKYEKHVLTYLFGEDGE